MEEAEGWELRWEGWVKGKGDTHQDRGYAPGSFFVNTAMDTAMNTAMGNIRSNAIDPLPERRQEMDPSSLGGGGGLRGACQHVSMCLCESVEGSNVTCCTHKGEGNKRYSPAKKEDK